MSDMHIDVLMKDHALIEKGLILMENEVKKGDKLNSTRIKALMEFLLEYGDKCHNMKEEKLYFPMLLELGLPPQGPIAVMLEEHKEERKYLELLENQVSSFETQGKLPADFQKNVTEYLELTKNHIWKENDILYPMGRKVITPEHDKTLVEEFEKLGIEILGDNGYERFAKMVDTLEKQSIGKINLLKSMSYAEIDGMLDSLPIEISYVDKDDTVKFFNNLEKKKIFPRTLSVVGRKVQQCHPQKSVHLVDKIISEMRSGGREKATFWLNLGDMLVHISYFAVRDEAGEYNGCVEMVQDIKPYRDLEGEKRLLGQD